MIKLDMEVYELQMTARRKEMVESGGVAYMKKSSPSSLDSKPYMPYSSSDASTSSGIK